MSGCPVCGGTGNAPGQRFCGDCGAVLPLACSGCGAVPARAEQKFCGECGLPLTGAAPTPPTTHEPTTSPDPSTPAAAAGELRWVSVVFVDLVGFTSWSEGRDPDVVRDLLSGYFALARTIVARYGGEVEKFIGDAVMAAWGAQVASEDDAERAVRAALDLVEAVERYGADSGVGELRARAGVVTGQVASWSSPGEGLVTGDRVNTAARAQAVAEPGTVLVDEATRLASQAAVAYEPAGTHPVKGKTEPLVLARAVRVVAAVAGAQRVDGLEAALVGRTRELALVRELFHGCIEAGRARLVLVSGVAGVGKSRLGWEFEKYVDGLSATVWWHRGRCLSYGDGVAFWALVEMVRQRFDIAQEDPSSAVVRKLAEGLPRWVPDEEERDFVFPRLATLLGAGEAELSRVELFAGWRLFWERMAATGSVVLVVEDLQWADAGFLDFVEHLMEWSTDLPIFVLALARPELADKRPGWLADRRNATTLQLDPLPGAAVEDMLDQLVPGMPVETRARIAARSEGVPLYAVETIRSLVDKDLVVPSGGVYTLAGDLGELEVPPTLTSLLAARLDLLAPDERDLVKGLAVLGGSFPRAAVSAVSELSPGRIDELLRALVYREILTVRNDPLSPERGEYAFRQTLLRSVAHDLITRRERKARHLAVAQHLRATFPDDGEEVAEVVAAHYCDAHDAAAGTADAEPIRVQAVDALARAGRRAHTVGALDSAQQAYLAAAGLATAEPEITAHNGRAAEMALDAGRFAEGLDLYEKVRGAHLAHDRPVELARTARLVSLALGRLGRVGEGIELMLAAVPVLESTDEVALAALEANLGARLWFVGRREEATVHVDRALSLAERHREPAVEAKARGIRGSLLATARQVTDAVREAAIGIDLAERHGLTLDEAYGRLNLGDILIQADLPGGAEQTRRAIQLARRVGDAGQVAFCAGNLATHAFFAGDWDEAEQAARQALETAPDDYQRDTLRYVLLLLHLARGRDTDAAAELTAIERLDGTDDVQDQTFLAVARAAAAHARQDMKAVHQAATAALATVVDTFGPFSEGYRLLWPLAAEAALRTARHDELQMMLDATQSLPGDGIPPYIQAQVHRSRALLAAARDRQHQVEDDLRRAVEILDGLGYPYFRAEAQTDLAHWLQSQSRHSDAEPVRDQARDTFTRLGAQPALARLDASMATAG